MKYNIKEVNMPPEGKCIRCGASYKGWALEIYRNCSCNCGGKIIIEPSKYSWIIERHPQPELRSRPKV
jgi:DNA-directed RNA polymerase subunit RPC12/RpoP